MSKIGRIPVIIPSGVKVKVTDDKVVVIGPKGELSVLLTPFIEVKVDQDQVIVDKNSESNQARANQGLVRSLINNCVIGVTQGYKKTLELHGTGYRVQSKGKGIELSLGFSHTIDVEPPEGISFKIESNNIIHIEGIDKQAVGQVAAEIRSYRPPEPYKGKGVHYQGEQIKRKAGKAAVS